MFQPTRPVRGAARPRPRGLSGNAFQPTRPVRGAAFAHLQGINTALGFNPRAPYGARQLFAAGSAASFAFQPTRPVRGAAAALAIHAAKEPVSTHAPRTGRGGGAVPPCYGPSRFNPRAPYGARPAGCRCFLPSGRFQPTRPVRGAANGCGAYCATVRCFNPRAPYGARQQVALLLVAFRQVSTHAPRTGRGLRGHGVRVAVVVSTHAPRTGRGAPDGTTIYATVLFQPTRPVRGAAPMQIVSDGVSIRFQPTRPVRGAAMWQRCRRAIRAVSTHAPRTGRGELVRVAGEPHGDVSTHAPRTGRGAPAVTAKTLSGVSTHAPRTGRGYRDWPSNDCPFCVSTHAPRTGRG